MLKLNKIQTHILYFGIFILVISEFAAGLIKPLWIDEIITIWQLESTNLFTIVEKFFQGYDTHPPLYFFIASILISIFGNSFITLKIFTFCLSTAGIFVIISTMKKMKFKNELSVTLLIIITAFYFSNFILSELRPYALYFLLSALVIRDVVQIFITQKYDSVLLRTIIYVLFLYSHYYAILYLILIVAVLFFSRVRNLKIYLPLFISILIYIPWCFAIINQMNTFENSTWHFLPSLLEIIIYPVSFFRYTSILFLPILIASLFMFKNERNKTLKNIVLLLLLFPYLNILIYLAGFEVYSFKYIIPSFIAAIIILPYGLKQISSAKTKTVLAILLLLIGAARVYNQINWSLNERDRIDSEISFNSFPMLCESPLDFTQLKYYSDDLGGTQISYPLVEYEGQSKKKKFENIWLNILKEEFSVKDIYLIEDYLKDKHEFYLVPAYDNSLSNYLISEKYNISKVNSSRLLKVSVNLNQ